MPFSGRIIYLDNSVFHNQNKITASKIPSKAPTTSFLCGQDVISILHKSTSTPIITEPTLQVSSITSENESTTENTAAEK